MNDKSGKKTTAKGAGGWKTIPERKAMGWSDLQLLPDFGIYHLTLNEAAELVVTDMWASGEFPEIDEPEYWDGRMTHPNMKELLSERVAKMYEQICASISAGRLDAICKRDFDEKIDTQFAFISFDNLVRWLDERGYHGGEIFDDWIESEANRRAAMAEHSYYLRAAQVGRLSNESLAFRRVMRDGGDIDESATIAELRAAVRQAFLEMQALKTELDEVKSTPQTQNEKTLLPRERKTILTIIAALCKGASIDYTGRDAVAKIERLVNKAGYSITDDTIRKYLKQAADFDL